MYAGGDEESAFEWKVMRGWCGEDGGGRGEEFG